MDPKMAAAATGGLDPKLLAQMGLDPATLASMDPKVLAAMADPKNLDPKLFGALAGMDPKMLAGLDPKAALDPKLLGFDPKMLDPSIAAMYGLSGVPPTSTSAASIN